jgi:hypothetical protein
MSDLHVHIRRVIVEAGADDVDVRTMPAALEAVLSSRFHAQSTHHEQSRLPSPTDAIADAIAAQVTPVAQGTGGRRA